MQDPAAAGLIWAKNMFEIDPAGYLRDAQRQGLLLDYDVLKNGSSKPAAKRPAPAPAKPKKPQQSRRRRNYDESDDSSSNSSGSSDDEEDDEEEDAALLLLLLLSSLSSSS